MMTYDAALLEVYYSGITRKGRNERETNMLSRPY